MTKYLHCVPMGMGIRVTACLVWLGSGGKCCLFYMHLESFHGEVGNFCFFRNCLEWGESLAGRVWGAIDGRKLKDRDGIVG